MEREIFVSTGGGISVFSLAGERLRAAGLEGAGALCVSDDQLFCAGDDGRVILRLDRRTLMVQALFAGGPGICDLLVSSDGTRLYALCADADSVLLLDACSGQPMIVSRAGCNPKQMALCGDVLAVAGGESGCVHLLDARTLKESGRMNLPGPVYSAALSGGVVHALCLTQSLDSILVTVRSGGREKIALCGMPGCLLRSEHALLAATQGRLHILSQDGDCVLGEQAAPGRAGRLLGVPGGLFAVDMLSERFFALAGAGGRWRFLCAQARAAAIG